MGSISQCPRHHGSRGRTLGQCYGPLGLKLLATGLDHSSTMLLLLNVRLQKGNGRNNADNMSRQSLWVSNTNIPHFHQLD